MYLIEKKSDLPHQQRVILEANELGTKIEALGVFITKNPIFGSLEDKERDRLKRQFTYMELYWQVLEERINAF